MSDPHSPQGMSVTVKQDEARPRDSSNPGTWIVFHGSPVSIREQIIETFALTESSYQTMPLYELVAEVTAIFKGTNNIAEALGGRMLPSNGNGSKSSGSAWSKVGTTPAGAKATEPEEDPDEVRLLAAIEAATAVKDLKELKARNESFFNEAVTTAYKAKGKSLLAANNN